MHDWVIEKVDYDFDTPLNVKNTVASSIFLNNKTAYAGYAKGYAELMNAAGIETFYLESRYGMHRAAWNIVNLYGDYHHVDCAFDDYGTSSGANPALCKTPKYDGFLLLDEEIEQLGYHEKWNVLTRESHYEMSWYQAYLETVHAMGEVCGVGCVTEQDADRIRAWLSGTATLSAAQRARADVDVDGRVSIPDAILIEQFIATGERSFHPFFAEHLKPKK